MYTIFIIIITNKEMTENKELIRGEFRVNIENIPFLFLLNQRLCALCGFFFVYAISPTCGFMMVTEWQETVYMKKVSCVNAFI